MGNRDLRSGSSHLVGLDYRVQGGILMALNLRTMDVGQLLALRDNIDRHLADRRRHLESQLVRISGKAPRAGTARGRRSLRGTKVPPKFRGPQGETWAGRGARPRWLTALLRQGHKIEEFAVDKPAGRTSRGGRKSTSRKRTVKQARGPRRGGPRPAKRSAKTAGRRAGRKAAQRTTARTTPRPKRVARVQNPPVAAPQAAPAETPTT